MRKSPSVRAQGCPPLNRAILSISTGQCICTGDLLQVSTKRSSVAGFRTVAETTAAVAPSGERRSEIAPTSSGTSEGSYICMMSLGRNATSRCSRHQRPLLSEASRRVSSRYVAVARRTEPHQPNPTLLPRRAAVFRLSVRSHVAASLTQLDIATESV